MKYLFLLCPLLFSCSFYTNSTQVTLSGLSKGRLVVTTKFYSQEILIDNDEYMLNVDKGVDTYVTFYPDFYGRESRYPSGAILELNKVFVTVSPHLGLLTSECNQLNTLKIQIDFENVIELKELLLGSDDPWIYVKEDIDLFIKGKIGISSISKLGTTSFPALEKYYSWIPENPLMNSWYPSIQSFFLPSKNSFFRLEIFEDSTFSGFVEVKKS